MVVEAGARELDRQRQADVAEADDADTGRALAQCERRKCWSQPNDIAANSSRTGSALPKQCLLDPAPEAGPLRLVNRRSLRTARAWAPRRRGNTCRRPASAGGGCRLRRPLPPAPARPDPRTASQRRPARERSSSAECGTARRAPGAARPGRARVRRFPIRRLRSSRSRSASSRARLHRHRSGAPRPARWRVRLRRRPRRLAFPRPPARSEAWRCAIRRGPRTPVASSSSITSVTSASSISRAPRRNRTAARIGDDVDRARHAAAAWWIRSVTSRGNSSGGPDRGAAAAGG